MSSPCQLHLVFLTDDRRFQRFIKDRRLINANRSRNGRKHTNAQGFYGNAPLRPNANNNNKQTGSYDVIGTLTGEPPHLSLVVSTTAHGVSACLTNR